VNMRLWKMYLPPERIFAFASGRLLS